MVAEHLLPGHRASVPSSKCAGADYQISLARKQRLQYPRQVVRVVGGVAVEQDYDFGVLGREYPG